VFKPRHQWHTFWNAGDKHCWIIEVISPAGFENFFREWAEVRDDMEQLKELDEKYGVDTDYDSVLPLCERFGLNAPGA
jgi:hypothetical protein